MVKLRTAVIGLVAAIAVPALVYAAGNWSTLPIVGQPSFCASTVSGVGLPSSQGPYGVVPGSTQGNSSGICGQTVPAGPPALTDEELIPADTGLTGGAPPQTVVIPSGMLGGLNLKVNRIVGGDFNTNLWQRGTTPLSASTSYTSAVMTADRWWVQGAASGTTQITVSKQTGQTSSVNDYPTGFYASLRVARPSSQSGVGEICIGQTLDKQAAAPLLGNNAILSFYSQSGANFSPTNQNITVQIGYFTAADATSAQSAVGAAGTNSLTSALSIGGQSGGITGFVAATAGTSPGYPSGTLSSGVQTISTNGSQVTSSSPTAGMWTRYAVYAPIPTANSAGTAVTGVVVGICWTPVGTAGSNDWIEFAGLQLQAMPSGATINLPNGLVAPTGFERRSPSVDALNQLYYSYVITEGSAAADASHGVGGSVTTSLAHTVLQYPVPTRIAPTIAYTTGFADTGAVGTPETCSALATVGTPTTNTATINCTATSGFTANQPAIMVDNGGNGVISVSAEP